MRKDLLPLLIISAALGGAFLLSRGGRSRESALPLSRAVAEHAKGIDRGAAVVFPMTPDEERRIGERLSARWSGLAPAPGTPEAARDGLWRELGGTAAASPLVQRFRGRYVFGVVPGSPNAFALPGGYVYGTHELVERLRQDEAALLFVLGHELGHVELGHCADAWRLRSGKDPVSAVVGGVGSIPRALASLHFNETQELEADAYAARLVRSLGRDPAAGLRVMDALGLPGDARTKRGSGEIAVEVLADYFRTHPGSWERRAAIEREAARR